MHAAVADPDAPTPDGPEPNEDPACAIAAAATAAAAAAATAATAAAAPAAEPAAEPVAASADELTPALADEPVHEPVLADGLAAAAWRCPRPIGRTASQHQRAGARNLVAERRKAAKAICEISGENRVGSS